MIKLGEVIAYFTFAVVLLVVIFIVTCKDANAQEPCPVGVVDLGETTSSQNPAQFVTQCNCVGWTAPTDIVVDHYHFYSGGILRTQPTTGAHRYCAAEKRSVEEIVIKAVAENVEDSDTTISNSLYIEWVDRQCLDGDRVVPCP